MAFLIPKENKEEEKLVGFHFYILMVYVKLVHFFCTATKNVNDMVNNTMAYRGEAPENLLDKLEETTSTENMGNAYQNKFQTDKDWICLPPRAQHVTLSNVEVYLDNFIGFIQGVPEKRNQMTCHLF